MSAENHHSGMDGTDPQLGCQFAGVPATSDLRAQSVHPPKYWNGFEKLRWQRRSSFAGAVAQFFHQRLSGPAQELVVFATPFPKGVAQSPHPPKGMPAFFSQRPTESVITAEGVPRVLWLRFQRSFSRDLKNTFPCIQCLQLPGSRQAFLRVSFGFADFFRFDFRDRIERAPRLFDCRFFFAISRTRRDASVCRNKPHRWQDIFTVATDEDLRKTWLGGAGGLCSRVQSHSIPSRCEFRRES